MRRADTGRRGKRTGDVRKDLTPDQLAWIASVALSYNEAERLVDDALGISLSLGKLSSDVVGRIYGVDGRVGLLKEALIHLEAPEPIREFAAATLGDGGFSLLKRFRDRIIHASVLDAGFSIGRSPAGRGGFEEVLLTVDGLKALYDRLELIRSELTELSKIVAMLVKGHDPANRFLNLSSGRGIPTVYIEQEILECFARYRRNQKSRLSLSPLPEFPSESELGAADERVRQERQAAMIRQIADALLKPPGIPPEFDPNSPPFEKKLREIQKS